jgi:hypothetical protein
VYYAPLKIKLNNKTIKKLKILKTLKKKLFEIKNKNIERWLEPPHSLFGGGQTQALVVFQTPPKSKIRVGGLG